MHLWVIFGPSCSFHEYFFPARLFLHMLSISPQISLHTHPGKQMYACRYTFRCKFVCTCVHIFYCTCVHTHTHRITQSPNSGEEPFTLSSSSFLETFPDKWPLALSLNPPCLRSSCWCETVPASGAPVIAGKLKSASRNSHQWFSACLLQQNPGESLSFLFTPPRVVAWQNIAVCGATCRPQDRALT